MFFLLSSGWPASLLVVLCSWLLLPLAFHLSCPSCCIIATEVIRTRGSFCGEGLVYHKHLSAASFQLIGGVSLVREKSIILSASVEFLIGLGISAAAVVSCADGHPTVVAPIHLFTMGSICIHGSGTPAIGTGIIL